MRTDRYRKKPVVIEAMRFDYTPDCITDLKLWLGKECISWGKERHPTAKGWMEIGTLEDCVEGSSQVKHIATEGDYIIRGVHGEFYACKPTIFEETYERVTE